MKCKEFSEDYKAISAKALYNAMMRNVRSGAVLVMHMSQNSVCTAGAPDLMLTELERRKFPLRFDSPAEDLH